MLPPAQRRSWLELAVVPAIVVLLTARWIWIAGGGDFGWTYEPAMRIFSGEKPYRDFLTTLPPLSFYTLAGLISFWSPSLWAFNVHLYANWILSLLAGVCVMRKLTQQRQLRIASALLATVLSLPAVNLNHAYNYQSTFFAGLIILFLLRWSEHGKAHDLLAAGLAAGLAWYAKQNVGGVMTLAGVLTVSVVCHSRGVLSLRVLSVQVAVFLAGWAIAFLLPFAWFAAAAGWKEVAEQFLVAPGEAKGGTQRILREIIPRIVLQPGTPLKTPTMFGLTALVAAFFVLLYTRGMDKLCRRN
ncbi:MAG: hypothetical protein N3B01_10465, partial [Verrucomicrobiae bacterium]|nr:hypothetical protein [Verrucomicrobiae bacterium]